MQWLDRRAGPSKHQQHDRPPQPHMAVCDPSSMSTSPSVSLCPNTCAKTPHSNYAPCHLTLSTVPSLHFSLAQLPNKKHMHFAELPNKKHMWGALPGGVLPRCNTNSHMFLCSRLRIGIGFDRSFARKNHSRRHSWKPECFQCTTQCVPKCVTGWTPLPPSARFFFFAVLGTNPNQYMVVVLKAGNVLAKCPILGPKAIRKAQYKAFC
jgi:hypothetical protein